MTDLLLKIIFQSILQIVLFSFKKICVTLAEIRKEYIVQDQNTHHACAVNFILVSFKMSPSLVSFGFA